MNPAGRQTDSGSSSLRGVGTAPPRQLPGQACGWVGKLPLQHKTLLIAVT